MKNTPLSAVPAKVDERPTLRTVANACGLAVTTVSRALNGGEDIALRTRERVQRIADEIGYVPNRAGRGLRTGRTQTISLVLAPHAEISGYTASIIAGLGDACRDSGYELAATPDMPDHDELAAVKSVVRSKRADGIVLSRTKPQDLRVRYLLEQGFPFVTHGRTELATPHACVDYDNQSFAEQAVHRLVAKGRHRMMLIGAAPGLTCHTHLELGFSRGVTVNGVESIAPHTPLNLETPLNELRQAITSICAKSFPPNGIVCGGEMATLAVLAGIRDGGLTPGVEVDVVAKQTSSTLDHVYPPVDAFFENITMTGWLLGNTLLQVIANQTPVEKLCLVIDPEARFRTSPISPIAST